MQRSQRTGEQTCETSRLSSLGAVREERAVGVGQHAVARAASADPAGRFGDRLAGRLP